MILEKLTVPLLNANEPEAKVITVHGKNGEYVHKDDVLFTLETTKATSEIYSNQTGYLHVFIKEGDTVLVGKVLSILTDTADENIQLTDINDDEELANDPTKIQQQFNIRITKPAQRLAESLSVDISLLPTGTLITEDVIRKYANKDQQPVVNISDYEKEPVIIYGGGGHAKTIIDLLKQGNEFSIAGIVDDNPVLTGEKIMDVPVIGTRTRLYDLRKMGIKYAVNCVGGILDINVRLRITTLLIEHNYSIATIIHPTATIEPSARISQGAQILAKTYIGSEAMVSEDSMINTGAVISHDCHIGKYSHIAPGVLLAGKVRVGERSLVGMGVTTSIGINIGSDVRIGNGAILLADVPDETIIQAGRFWVGKTEK